MRGIWNNGARTKGFIRGSPVAIMKVRRGEMDLKTAQLEHETNDSQNFVSLSFAKPSRAVCYLYHRDSHYLH